MNAATFELPPQCLERAQRLLATGKRQILGIAAPPGAGKSTLAAALARALGAQAQVVPMDGFHLANAELERLGRAQRKGAPDTFDAEGYVHLLGRIRRQAPGETIYAPEFHRELEEGVAGSIAINAATPLIITEGNYLLLDSGPWAQVLSALDVAWYLDVDDRLRQARLLERHMRFGRSPEAALDWITHTDEPNAHRVIHSQHRAHWMISGNASRVTNY